MTTGIFKIVEEIHNVYDESESPDERRQPKQQTRTIHTDIITAASSEDAAAYGQFMPSDYHAQTIITTVSQSNNEDGSIDRTETVEGKRSAHTHTLCSMTRDKSVIDKNVYY